MADEDNIEVTESETIVIRIHSDHRNSRVQPVGVNGRVTNVPVGVDTPVTPAVASAIVGAGIPHTIVSGEIPAEIPQPETDAGAAPAAEGSSAGAATAPIEVVVKPPEMPLAEVPVEVGEQGDKPRTVDAGSVAAGDELHPEQIIQQTTTAAPPAPAAQPATEVDQGGPIPEAPVGDTAATNPFPNASPPVGNAMGESDEQPVAHEGAGSIDATTDAQPEQIMQQTSDSAHADPVSEPLADSPLPATDDENIELVSQHDDTVAQPEGDSAE